jgi:hypothetical protein
MFSIVLARKFWEFFFLFNNNFIFQKIYETSINNLYTCMFFSFCFCYMYFFRSFICFHLITIHSFLFSQGQKNIDIDLNLFCSYCVIIYPLYNNNFIAYFVIHDTIVVIYILAHISSSIVWLFCLKLNG